MKPIALKRPLVRRATRRQRAAALVEFAVVLPVLLLILFGIMEFGQLFRVRQTCLHAAREAARLAVLQSTAKPYSMLSITEDTVADPTVTVTVTVPYEEVRLTGFLGMLTDSVSGTCSMRKEGV